MRQRLVWDRSAFTLIELLVVITIIGILIGLLLPAVNSVRESARRTQCNNHIRQLSMAFVTHETTHGFYPSAGGPDWTYHMTYIGGKPARAPDQHGGWGFQILPFIEAENVWLGGGKEDDIDKSIVAISTPNPLFFCPSRRDPEALVAKDWLSKPKNSGKTFPHAKNDYAVSSLNRDAGKGFPNGIGACQQMVQTYAAEIRDGLSQTTLISEKQLNLKHVGKMIGHDNEGYTCGWNHDTVRHTSRQPEPDFRDNNIGNLNGDRFGSSHVGGLMMSTADGTVHFVVFDVELKVWSAMGHRADSVAFDAPW